MDPSSYLELANDLARGASPASLRSAGDRAYYAAFLFARDRLYQKNYSPFFTGPGAHRDVKNALLAILPQVGHMEDNLRRARNVITYETSMTRLRSGQSIPWMLGVSGDIIEAVRALPENA